MSNATDAMQSKDPTVIPKECGNALLTRAHYRAPGTLSFVSTANNSNSESLCARIVRCTSKSQYVSIALGSQNFTAPEIRQKHQCDRSPSHLLIHRAKLMAAFDRSSAT